MITPPTTTAQLHQSLINLPDSIGKRMGNSLLFRKFEWDKEKIVNSNKQK